MPLINSVNTPIAISSPIDPCSNACRVKIDVVCTPLGCQQQGRDAFARCDGEHDHHRSNQRRCDERHHDGALGVRPVNAGSGFELYGVMCQTGTLHAKISPILTRICGSIERAACP